MLLALLAAILTMALSVLADVLPKNQGPQLPLIFSIMWSQLVTSNSDHPRETTDGDDVSSGKHNRSRALRPNSPPLNLVTIVVGCRFNHILVSYAPCAIPYTAY